MTEWLSTDEAAAHLRELGRRCSAGYLAKKRCLGTGPRFYKRNGQVAYMKADLETWAENPSIIRTSGPFTKASDAAPAPQLEAVA
jgi:hypothetical protein